MSQVLLHVTTSCENSQPNIIIDNPFDSLRCNKSTLSMKKKNMIRNFLSTQRCFSQQIYTGFHSILLSKQGRLKASDW